MKNHRRNRIVMELYEAGLTYSMIAAHMGITRNTVAGIVHRNKAV